VAGGKAGRGGAVLWTADGAVTTREGTGRGGGSGRGVGRGSTATPTGEPRVAGGGVKFVRMTLHHSYVIKFIIMY